MFVSPKMAFQKQLQVLIITWASDLYLIYKLSPKNDPSYQFIGEVILKINIV